MNMTMTISTDHGAGHPDRGADPRAPQVGVGHLVARRPPVVPGPVLLTRTGPRLLVQARDEVSTR
jgi:hypothetical protein